MGRRVKPAKVKTKTRRPLARKAPTKRVARLRGSDSDGKFVRVPLLSRLDCERALVGLFRLEPYWYSTDGGGLHTFGSPAYRNASAPDVYLRQARRDNGLLWTSFSWLYRRVLACLTDLLSAPCAFMAQCAAPGFHVFRFRNQSVYLGGGGHFDLSFLTIPWPDGALVDPSEHLSFTIALRLPAAPAGLDVWDLGYHEIKDGTFGHDIAAVATARQRVFQRYALGELNLYSGLYWHQIAPIETCAPDEERITFQGHAVSVDGRWILYW